MKARKRFGQHFLHDRTVVERIADAVAPRPHDAIVEIGPGQGVLTQQLLSRTPAPIDAVEIDRDLVALLRERHRADRLVIHEADALDFDFAALAAQRGRRLRVVGNLPYNVSTPLLFHLLANPASLEDLHVMLQREVIDRMAAAPGTEDYGRLTVMLAPWTSVEKLFDVGPGAFNPPPRVWSSVARLTVREAPAFELSPSFGALVTEAFSQRRKTLRNALRARLDVAQIEALGIDPGCRAETLAPAQFAALARAADRR